MGAADGRPDTPVERRLFEEGYSFDFFQAVRLLERLYATRSPVGRVAAPDAEAARFRSHASLSFPASAIHKIERAEEGWGQPQVTVSMLGLTGPEGVLPQHYTELVLDRARRKDRALWEFLDVFVHRLVSLFYRAWEKYRFAIGYERARGGDEAHDRLSHYLFDLFGLGAKGLRRRLAVEDRQLLFYAGLLAQHPRSASALRSLLRDYFGVPIRVTQCIGQWLPLSVSSRTRLGRRAANHALGDSAIVGRRCWDQQASFRVHVGPLDLKGFENFLPSGKALQALVQLTRFFAGQEYDFDVQLVLTAAEVPRCELGAKGACGPRLGWSAWLKTVPFTHDADDTILAGRLTRIGALPD